MKLINEKLRHMFELRREDVQYENEMKVKFCPNDF